jgi:hypothetical protein
VGALTFKMSKGLASRIAVVLAIKMAGVFFATMIFARFTPLVDSDLYLQGFYQLETSLRLQIVQRLAIVLKAVVGAQLTHWSFGVISTAGIIYYFVTGGRRWSIVLTLLFPSALVWTSIVGKEAIFFGCFSLLLVIWSKYAVDSLNRIDWIAAFFALAIASMLRPHYAGVIVWLFFSTGIVRKWGTKALPVVVMSMLVCAFAVYLLEWDDLLRRGFGGIEPSARASRFDAFGIEPQTEIGKARFERFVPLGTIQGIIGPMPQEVLSRPEFLPFFLEGLFILLSPYLIYRYSMGKKFEKKELFIRLFFWCLLPTIGALMILHAPFGILNPGSATRWRTNFEAIFYLAPLLLLFRCLDDVPNEGSSLSSRRPDGFTVH